MSGMTWRLLGSFVLAATPGGVYAADGIVLIDQSSALAGNVTAGDERGFPVTISESGSYRLSGNLVVSDANTTAIQITADNVILDLNGFSIFGPTTCIVTFGAPAKCAPPGSGTGVQASSETASTGPRGVKVFNGAVRGMGRHGFLILSEGSVADRLTADSNAAAGIVVTGVVIDSTATNNGQTGIAATTVRGSIAMSNGGDGIDVTMGVAVGNGSSYNGGAGFGIFNSTAVANTANQNSGFGIETLCPSSIVDNTLFANKKGNIEQDGNSGCVLTSNATRP